MSLKLEIDLDIVLERMHPQQRVGFRDGMLGATRRVYKRARIQAVYDKYFAYGRRWAYHGMAQKIGDVYARDKQ